MKKEKREGMDLEEVIELYGRLEMAVQREMNACCAGFCTVCPAPCCRVHFCRESLESPFLAQIRHRFARDARWDDAWGWLTPRGCGLTAGRPPVCYEFLCGPILRSPHPGNHMALPALKQLAMLITAAGHRARSHRHLVELDDLSRLNIARLKARLIRSGEILAGLTAVENGGTAFVKLEEKEIQLFSIGHQDEASVEGGGGLPSAPSL